MPTAIVVFADIEKFTRKSEVRQRELVEAMTSDVLHEIRDLLLPPAGAQPRAVVLPTGDGMAVALIESGSPHDDFQRALSLAARLFLFAETESRNGTDPVRLRVGLHQGGVQYVTDVNGRTNVCGAAINQAQRVMDAANPGQCLISEAIKEKYLDGNGERPFPLSRCHRCRSTFSDPHEVLVKHGRRVTVRVAEVWCDDQRLTSAREEEPLSKKLAVLTQTGLPKDIDPRQGFALTLGNARSVGLIQLTGEFLLPKLHDDTVTLSPHLERLWVFMPTAESLRSFPASPLPTAEAQRGHIAAWREYLTDLATRRPKVDIWLGLFAEPPYFGASLLDWDRPAGTIHVSPYVWNTTTKMCPGFDISWSDCLFPEVAKAYVEGLKYLRAHSEDGLSITN
ncbi:MAG: adenylate/guanylate cyclase domain-containing protein [Alphaproteobacteria bacterium]